MTCVTGSCFKVHGNILDVYLLQPCWNVIIVTFAPAATAYFMFKALVQSMFFRIRSKYTVNLGEICCCCSPASVETAYEHSCKWVQECVMVRAWRHTWKDIERFDPLDSLSQFVQKVCRNSVPVTQILDRGRPPPSFFFLLRTEVSVGSVR